jgi:hypothetical protein
LTWPKRFVLPALTALTLLVHGYHPLAEDGGLYMAGVQYKLDPTLFPHFTEFVTEHLRFSLFAPTLAALVHITHPPLLWVLLLLNLFSIALTLYAAQAVLRRCTTGDAAQLSGLCLLTAFWTLPIAGTSLLLMDPYVTARSLSTPLSLLAIAYALDDWPTLKPRVAHSSQLHRDGWGAALVCAACLLLAAIFHPLMAAYALAFVVTLRLTRLRRRYLAYALLTLAALALAATLQALAPAESPAYLVAALSRYYWFLSQWQWHELLGLAGPLAVLAALLRWRQTHLTPAATALLRASIALGLVATLTALLFAHEDYATHLVARLQPLRVFLLIYAVMTMLLGATLVQILRDIRLRALLLLSLCTIMFFVQRNTFPASPHIELPGHTNHNPWVQAFIWARDNTPADALFALDAKYVNEGGEDAQTFRAWSLRSAIPDYSKDGGEASITPVLAATWQQAAAAQKNLSTESDAERDAKLSPLGVIWVVLHSSASTRHACPYDNGTVKVCQLAP